MAPSAAKLAAARAAVRCVQSGMTVGLGSGSTATIFIQLLGEALAQGSIRDIRGLATSVQSEQLARSLDIPLVDFSQCTACDVTIDGADEVTDQLDLIKGLGGALLREKVVAQNSRMLVIIAEPEKRVKTLGTRSPLPVEVTRFGLAAHERFLRSLGSEPELRRAPDGLPYLTDNGNHIFDCRFPQGLPRPGDIARSIAARAGMVEHGLFLGIAQIALIGKPDGTLETLTRGN